MLEWSHEKYSDPNGIKKEFIHHNHTNASYKVSMAPDGTLLW